MTYKIDPDRDRPYIEEFRQQPIGAHSPGLQRLLNLLRYDPAGSQVILGGSKVRIPSETRLTFVLDNPTRF